MPRDSVARNPVQKFHPVGKAAIPVAGGADPGRGAERFSERLLCGEPVSNQRIRIRVLKDVACRPNVKTGANVPSYSGGGGRLDGGFVSVHLRSIFGFLQCLKLSVQRSTFILSAV